MVAEWSGGPYGVYASTVFIRILGEGFVYPASVRVWPRARGRAFHRPFTLDIMRNTV